MSGELLEEPTDALNMGELLDSIEPMKPLRRGDIVEGIVMRADTDGVLVNIGHKAEGLVPPGEMRSLNREGAEPLKVGDEVVAAVVKGESEDGNVILSVDRAAGEKGWHTLEKALESGVYLNGKILGFNRGGAIVEVDGVQCFVPMSQLVSVSRDQFRQREEAAESRGPESTAADAEASDETAESTPADAEASDEAAESTAADAEASDEAAESTPADAEASDEATESNPADAEASDEAGKSSEPPPHEEPEGIGKNLVMKVLEVNRGRNRAILSERVAVQEQRDERKAKLIEELNEGEVRRGRVTGISSFGAFVDLGGADGLIHISELSWTPVRSPDEILKIGDDIEVYVLRVDERNRKIALSLKRLQREPWETIDQHLEVGEVVDATVTKLTEFGAFARVEGSVEGLIHISEMASRVINHPRDVLREGDDVRVKVLRIEPERRRLGLSLRQAEEEEGI